MDTSDTRLSAEHVIDIGKPMHSLYDDLDKSMVMKIITQWNDLPECKPIKLMCEAIYQKYGKILLAVDRRFCRNLIGMLTGLSLVADSGRTDR